ncbi:MAG TPA: GAF domain-containing protein, partial [Thermoanaerobaculia bacterium]|nr:GAF domain-containing protein [Thermoanaerobaculia bacterium]
MTVSESHSIGLARPIAGELERAQYEVLDVAIQIFGCDLSVLFPMNPLTGDFGWPPCVRGNLLDGQSAFDRPRPDGLAHHILTESILKIEDLRRTPEYASKFTQQEKILSFIAVEIDLPKRPKPLAVVYIDFREPRTFGDGQEQLILQFVGRAGAILRRAWRYEKVLDLGHEINQQLDDPRTLFRLLDDRLRDIIDGSNLSCLGVLDPVTDSVTKYVSTAYGVIEEERAPLLEAERQAIFAGPVARLRIREAQLADEIFVPMVFRNVPLGFLSIEQPQSDPFDNEDLRVIELLRNHVATALNGMRLFADLNTISQVTKHLHEELTSVDAFCTYAENVRQGAGADVVILYRWAADEGRFILPPFVAGELLEPDFLQPSRPDPMFARIVDYDEGVFCEDASTLPTELGLKGGGGTFQKREKVASAAAISLRVGETVGVLFINYRKPQQFGGPRKRLIRILAAFAATALQSSQRFLEREGQYSQEMEIVRRVDAELNRTTRLYDVLHTILRLANGYVQAEEASLLLADAKGEKFKLLVAIGSELTKSVGWEKPITGSEGIVRWVFENRKAVLVRDLENEERWRDLYIGATKTRSELDVPLVDSDRVIGVLNFESHRKNAFTDRQKEFIRNIAGQFVLAVKRAQDYEARAAELKLFWDFTRDTVGHLETPQLLDVTLEKTIATIGATAGALLWYDNATGTFVATTTRGYGVDAVPANRYRIGEGLIGTTTQNL